MSQRKTSPFGFDTVFDANGKIVRESALKAQKKTFTPEEVEAIRQDAYAAGAGSIEARAAQTMAMAVGEIATAVMRMLETLDHEIARVHREATDIALAAGRKIAGAALDRFPTAEVERLIAECLDALPAEPRLVVRVAPDLVEALQGRIEALIAERGFTGRLVLVAETSLQGTAARIEWSEGGIERDSSNLDDEIAGRVASHLSAAAGDLTKTED